MRTFQPPVLKDPALEAACRAFAIPDRVPATAREVAFLATAARSRLRVDAQDIVYWTFGTGPCVLLVHGWCSRGSHLMGFVEPLVAKGFSVVLFDAPAHGDSGGVVSSMIHAGQAVLALVRTLGDVHALISHSGGSTAALWALANGLSVEKSVHIAGPSSVKQVVIDSAHAHGLGPNEAQAFERWVEAFTSIRLDSADLRALTSGLGHQGLIVHDAGDRVVNLSQSQALHYAWTSSTLVITDGFGHRRILNAPQTLTAIAGFL
jgi:pimeloyl-ACP methyl ester carboxylesterase